MIIRKLELKDAAFMLEWMHDKGVVENLATNFEMKTIDDCVKFIETSQSDNENIHFAIADDFDEYMGTVSLKHVDKDKSEAEFAITVRSRAMGQGYSWFGMKSILMYGLSEVGMDSIYWCVSKLNKRAVRFYEKHGFSKNNDISSDILERYNNDNRLFWFRVKKGDTF